MVSLTPPTSRERDSGANGETVMTSANARARARCRCAETVLSVRKSCVKRRARDGAETRAGRRRATVAFAREESVVIGRADADVDRTPRNEPVKCTCCALHVVGYAFE